ncbi:uncharacterized protein (DUF433 family) [Mesorhizobium soli]|uniref:DUF433 domain-containing protein n=1 Tax=Pseudaminobacter soli (ex Li et al. 2025) TaxID=1295366 RepID=UPI002474FB0E|nr:DUF433 domain-containing protein [Mesorhizobium soli]MDH6235045.1 uncharacterized protein (DUF433 family) [Mesorhizobium soli]
MAAVAEMLKPSEAAVVSRVTLREVNRAIDEHILPDAFVSADNGRHVLAAACSLITFYFESAKRLTAEERVLAIRAAEPRIAKARSLDWAKVMREDWMVHHDFLTIDLKPFVQRVRDRLADLEAAREAVESAPDILSGTPVLRGTRVPVYDVAASVAAGRTTEEILTAWPGLDANLVWLATIYAEANPPRGRPRGIPGLPKGAVIITNKRVPRRRNAG